MVEIYKFTKECYSKGYFHTAKLVNTKRYSNFPYSYCYMFPYFGKDSDRIYVRKSNLLKGAYYIEFYDRIKDKFVHANFDTIYIFVSKTDNVDELIAANAIVDSILNEEQK
jgi:hypothetical protein